MTDIIQSLENLRLVGLHQRTLPARVRDSLFAEEPDPEFFIKRMSQVGSGEICVVATCERLEVFAVHSGSSSATAFPSGLEKELAETLAGLAAVSSADLLGALYHRQGRAAAAHLFRLAASLDSQVIGEPQILGQVKENYRIATAASHTGPLLEALFPAAFAAAARVRHETPLAEQPVSITTSALQIARRLHGDLTRVKVLLIGLGEMSELLGADFQRAPVAEMVVSHEFPIRAEAVAVRLGCHHRPMAELPDSMARADIIVSDRGAGRWTVTHQMVADALKRRRNRPIFLIDAALPGDIDPSAGELPDAFLYDLQDLETAALKGRSSRQAAIQMAEAILDEELEALIRRSAERAAGPTLAALHGHFERIRLEILEDPKLDRESATRLLVKRLLHRPSQVLRDEAGDGVAREFGRAEGKVVSNQGKGDPLSAAVRRLFGLSHSDQ